MSASKVIQSSPKANTGPVTNVLKGVLIERNLQVWKSLIANNFCHQMLITKRSDPNYAQMNARFKWYMVQDRHFLEYNVRLKLSGDLRNAPWSKIVADKSIPANIRTSIDYVEDFRKNILMAKLGITDKNIQDSKPAPVLQAYMDYLNNIDKAKDPFALNCVKAACQVSYEMIANAAVPGSGIDTGTLFYDAWVKPNQNYGSIKKFTDLLDKDQPVDLEKQLDHYVEVFNGGAQRELNFWTAALNNSDNIL